MVFHSDVSLRLVTLFLLLCLLRWCTTARSVLAARLLWKGRAHAVLSLDRTCTSSNDTYLLLGLTSRGDLEQARLLQECNTIHILVESIQALDHCLLDLLLLSIQLLLTLGALDRVCLLCAHAQIWRIR